MTSERPCEPSYVTQRVPPPEIMGHPFSSVHSAGDYDKPIDFPGKGQRSTHNRVQDQPPNQVRGQARVESQSSISQFQSFHSFDQVMTYDSDLYGTIYDEDHSHKYGVKQLDLDFPHRFDRHRQQTPTSYDPKARSSTPPGAADLQHISTRNHHSDVGTQSPRSGPRSSMLVPSFTSKSREDRGFTRWSNAILLKLYVDVVAPWLDLRDLSTGSRLYLPVIAAKSTHVFDAICTLAQSQNVLYIPSVRNSCDGKFVCPNDPVGISPDKKLVYSLFLVAEIILKPSSLWRDVIERKRVARSPDAGTLYRNEVKAMDLQILKFGKIRLTIS